MRWSFLGIKMVINILIKIMIMMKWSFQGILEVMNNKMDSWLFWWNSRWGSQVTGWDEPVCYFSWRVLLKSKHWIRGKLKRDMIEHCQASLAFFEERYDDPFDHGQYFPTSKHSSCVSIVWKYIHLCENKGKLNIPVLSKDKNDVVLLCAITE